MHGHARLGYQLYATGMSDGVSFSEGVDMSEHKRPFAIVLSVILGAIGLALVFSDLGPDESWPVRAAVAASYFFLCGVGIGLLSRDQWYIAGLSAWGGVLFGGYLVLVALGSYGTTAFEAKDPPFISSGLILLFVPIALSLLGGYIGSQLSNRRTGEIRLRR